MKSKELKDCAEAWEEKKACGIRLYGAQRVLNEVFLCFEIAMKEMFYGFSDSQLNMINAAFWESCSRSLRNLENELYKSMRESTKKWEIWHNMENK